MSNIFYDHLVRFEKIEILIKESVSMSNEKEELWQVVDEIVHHRVMHCILENLPTEYHSAYLTKFHRKPHDKDIISFLNDKSGKDMEKEISNDLIKLEEELLNDLTNV